MIAFSPNTLRPLQSPGRVSMLAVLWVSCLSLTLVIGCGDGPAPTSAQSELQVATPTVTQELPGPTPSATVVADLLPTPTPTPTSPVQLTREQALSALTDFLLEEISLILVSETRDTAQIRVRDWVVTGFLRDCNWFLTGPGRVGDRWTDGRWTLQEAEMTITGIDPPALALLETLNTWKQAVPSPTPGAVLPTLAPTAPPPPTATPPVVASSGPPTSAEVTSPTMTPTPTLSPTVTPIVSVSNVSPSPTTTVPAPPIRGSGH